jgi:hypothetical protein
LGLLFAVAFPVGLYRGFKTRQAWFFPLALYLFGHLLIGHKEPRFMAPVETLMIFAVYQGILELRIPPVYFQRGLVALLIVNSALFLRATWGENLKKTQSFEAISSLIQPQDCAVITVIRPMGVRLPKIPLGYFPAKTREAITPESGDLAERPVLWQQVAPACQDPQTLLIHLTRAHPFWSETQRCELLSSGLLKIVPQSFWPKVTPLMSGSWYRCPIETLSLFKKQETRKVLATAIRKLEILPGLKTTASDLKRLTLENSDPGIQDGVMVDF